MPSPVAPVAVKPMPANPASSAGSSAAADASTSNNTNETTNSSGGFAQMLLLQLGLGEAPASAPVVSEQLAASPLTDSKKDSKDDAATDPANGLSALFAALGIPQPKDLLQTPITNTSSEATVAVAGAAGSDAAAGVTGPNSGAVLGAAKDGQAAKLAGFEETLLKAETKLEANVKTTQEVPPAVAAMHTPDNRAVNNEATTHVATPVRDPNWASDFSQKVVWVASQEKQSAHLTLNPPQLGPLEVTISVNKDQTTATFSSPHSEVRQAIENAMPQLRDAFAAAGIQLGQANVNSESFRQQQDNQQRPNQNRGNGDNGILAGDSDSDNIIATTPIRRSLSQVDTFA
jgi:flagellar hook-length control protein FliK